MGVIQPQEVRDRLFQDLKGRHPGCVDCSTANEIAIAKAGDKAWVPSWKAFRDGRYWVVPGGVMFDSDFSHVHLILPKPKPTPEQRKRQHLINARMHLAAAVAEVSTLEDLDMLTGLLGRLRDHFSQLADDVLGDPAEPKA